MINMALLLQLLFSISVVMLVKTNLQAVCNEGRKMAAVASQQKTHTSDLVWVYNRFDTNYAIKIHINQCNNF